ncbi:MAG: hypothetical protein Kow0010_25580 [Dehalococcoidia bacterium]
MTARARILVDASALVPLADERDQWRPMLLATLEGLRRAGRPAFVTTNWTLYEALALCRRRSRALAASLYHHVRDEMSIVAVSSPVEAEAVQRFLHWDDKQVSVVDHANLLVAESYRCEAVLTFDGDFAPLVAGTGMRLLGGR